MQSREKKKRRILKIIIKSILFRGNAVAFVPLSLYSHFLPRRIIRPLPESQSRQKSKFRKGTDESEKENKWNALSGEEGFLAKTSTMSGAKRERLPCTELPVTPHALCEFVLVPDELLSPWKLIPRGRFHRFEGSFPRHCEVSVREREWTQ